MDRAATSDRPELDPHFFRHEFGQLVAALTRRFGVARVELCEDAAQTALLRALQTWPVQGPPGDKRAWLRRVARNALLDALRKQKRAGEQPLSAEPEVEPEADNALLPDEVRDDMLRLLFVCSDPLLPAESQLVLALKILCGFSTSEIALRLFQSEEAVHKRLQRARSSLREAAVALDTPALESLTSRRPAVLHMLYLLFTEGYSSAQPDVLIRHELCEEALRLGHMLIEHRVGDAPETWALLALMLLHAARFPARQDGAGELLLLPEQDRAVWDRMLIQQGMAYLQRAAQGDNFSRYHAEAGIALEHCLAPTYAQTRWEEIARLYQLLDRVAPSPLNTLNRAVACAEQQGARAGLVILEAMSPPAWLREYYLWDATLGELYRRAGDKQRARHHLQRAQAATPTRAEKALLARRLSTCQDPD